VDRLHRVSVGVFVSVAEAVGLTAIVDVTDTTRVLLPMKRLTQSLLITATLAFSWLAMMAVHEAGHVLHAWASGGAVQRVVLHPLAISRTDVSPNPHPLFVAWGGAIWGCLIPLAIWGLAHWLARPHAYLARFFAGFCLIANGAYLAAGSLSPKGDDAGTILRHGGAQWQLIAFGLFAAAAGLYVWNRLGTHFGLGEANGRVDRRAAVGMTLALLVVVVLELLFFKSG
jgi:hypothetical protein